jgi:site-specific recombinase XerD
MANDLVPTDGAGALAKSIEAAAGYAKNSKAPNTLKAYRSDWRHFSIWCAAVRCKPLPAHPGQVAAYLGALASADMRTNTIQRRIAAIRHFHRAAGHENPCEHPGIADTLAGIRRSLGSAPRKKTALTAELLSRALRKLPDTLRGKRDRALLLIGFAGALRRSELVDLKVNDLAAHPKGIILTLRRSKTDQVGAGTVKAIPHGHRLKAVAALEDWLRISQICDGPIFRGVIGKRVLDGALCEHQVAKIVKNALRAIGLDAREFSGHSLRSGFITSAANSGADLTTIAKHAGHARVDTTLGYVQVNDAFRDHAGRKFL